MASEPPSVASTLAEIQASLRDLHIKVDSLTAKSQAVPPPSIPSPLINTALYSSVVKGIAEEEKIREKSKRAVLVGSAELATPEETAKMDEENLKLLIQKANNSELSEAYAAGLFSHKRHPEKKKEGQCTVVKYNCSTNTLRDKFLSCIRVIGGRPDSFTPSMYVRRDLMPIELLQEKKAKAEALRLNRECGFLKWGVRDTDLIMFNVPKYRPLPDRLREGYVRPNVINLITDPIVNEEPEKETLDEPGTTDEPTKGTESLPTVPSSSTISLPTVPSSSTIPLPTVSSSSTIPLPTVLSSSTIPPPLAREPTAPSNITLRKKAVTTSNDTSIDPIDNVLTAGGNSTAMKERAPKMSG